MNKTFEERYEKLQNVCAVILVVMVVVSIIGLTI